MHQPEEILKRLDATLDNSIELHKQCLAIANAAIEQRNNLTEAIERILLWANLTELEDAGHLTLAEVIREARNLIHPVKS